MRIAFFEKHESEFLKVFISLFSFFFLSVIPNFNIGAFASDWDLSLYLTDPRGGQHKLIAGADRSATDGFDNLHDFSASFAGPQEGSVNPVQAALATQVYFYHGEYPPDVQFLLKDIRFNDFSSPGSWRLDVRSNQTGMFRWDWVFNQSNQCQSYNMTLTDLADGTQLDLSMKAPYFFVQNTTDRSFLLKVSAAGGSLQAVAPQGLWSPRQGSETVLLSWSAAGAKYRIYRSVTPGAGYGLVNDIPIQDLYFVDRGVKRGKTYYYVVTSVNEDGCESPFSNEAMARLP